jgi:regulator of chromosome condensation
MEEYDNAIAVPTRLTRFVDSVVVKHVACGGMHTLAVIADGSLFSWGNNDEGALGHESVTPAIVPLPG